MGVVEDARRRADEEVRAAIVHTARAQLAEVGAAALSLRKVARDLDMVSSAVYRFVRDRDELLTLLILRAYEDLGDAAEDAVRADAAPADQLIAVARAVRAWAVANPQEYALLYGSPVPGYAAPADTIPSGSRVILLLARIVAGAGPVDPPVEDAGLAVQLDGVAGELGVDLGPGAVARMVALWSQIFGLVSMEVFGQLQNTDVDGDALIAQTVGGMVAHLGLGA